MPSNLLQELLSAINSMPRPGMETDPDEPGAIPLSQAVQQYGDEGLKKMYPDGVQKHVAGGSVTDPLVKLPKQAAPQAATQAAPQAPATAQQVGGMYDKFFENTPNVAPPKGIDPSLLDALSGQRAPQQPQSRSTVSVEAGEPQMPEQHEVKVTLGTPKKSVEKHVKEITVKVPRHATPEVLDAILSSR